VFPGVETVRTKLVQKPLREWKGNVTEDIINRLSFPVIKNNVQFISVIIDGGKGSGKTMKMLVLAELIVERIKEMDESYNIIPVRSISQVHEHFTNDHYQIALIDDGSRYDKNVEAGKAIEQFNEIRHIFEKEQNKKEGVLIVIWTLQDSFQIGKRLRKDLSAYIFTDFPLDEYSQNFIKRVSHPRALHLLSSWAQKIKDEHRIEFKNRCIITTESWAGYGVFPLPSEQFRRIEFIEPVKEEEKQEEQEEEEEEEEIVEQIEDGEVIFEEVA